MCGPENAPALSISTPIAAVIRAFTMRRASVSPGCRWARCSARKRPAPFSVKMMATAPSTGQCHRTPYTGATCGSCRSPSTGRAGRTDRTKQPCSRPLHQVYHRGKPTRLGVCEGRHAIDIGEVHVGNGIDQRLHLHRVIRRFGPFHRHRHPITSAIFARFLRLGGRWRKYLSESVP